MIDEKRGCTQSGALLVIISCLLIIGGIVIGGVITVGDLLMVTFYEN
jgi:hypothetical protein